MEIVFTVYLYAVFLAWCSAWSKFYDVLPSVGLNRGTVINNRGTWFPSLSPSEKDYTVQ